jgi:hypothetical protein
MYVQYNVTLWRVRIFALLNACYQWSHCAFKFCSAVLYYVITITYTAIRINSYDYMHFCLNYPSCKMHLFDSVSSGRKQQALNATNTFHLSYPAHKSFVLVAVLCSSICGLSRFC